MSFDPYEFDRDYGQSSRMESIGQYTAKTFLWMVLGLLVTFGIALLGWVTNATLYALAYVPYIHLIVLIATIVLSITMVSRIEKMSVGTARGIFIAFSALFGFTMSMYLYIFEFGSLIFVFLATAAYFAVLAAYGYFTKADLTRLRPILFTGLVFLFVFALVSLFIPGFTALDRIFCLAGIAIFLGYTAYDTQKIKAYYNYYGLPRHAGEGVYFLRPSVVPGFHQPVFVPAALFGQVPELSAPLNREREDLSHRQVLFSILFIDS